MGQAKRKNEMRIIFLPKHTPGVALDVTSQVLFYLTKKYMGSLPI